MKTLFQRVKRQKMTLATNLQKVVDWTLTGDNLILNMPNPFVLSMIRQEVAFLSRVASEVLGKGITVTPELIKGEDLAKQNEVDPQVELVTQIFRGHIVKGK